MKLQRIEISNYRSIEFLELNITPIDNSFTYTLLGINESGKSNILKAINLYDSNSVNFPLDYFNPKQPITISFSYLPEDSDIKDLNEKLMKEHDFEKDLLAQIEINQVTVKVEFANSVDNKQLTTEEINFKEHTFPSYTIKDGKVLKKIRTANEESQEESLNLVELFRDKLPTYFWSCSHITTFWKSSPEYLISDEIDLAEFAKEPSKVSIPLKNCFELAKLKDIKTEISQLGNPVAIQNLEEILGDKITKHIKNIWPQHPIKIKFKINNNKLSFLVEDLGVKFKNKMTRQRSDGFRQLISFLLTLSAQNRSENLSNSILILDEPETHLHPTAQINLRNELIKLSKSESNNIVFYATHSNYMIDKDNMERSFIIRKKENEKTEIENVVLNKTSYSEVNYVVFDIPTNDYHNELYGSAEELQPTKLNNITKDRKWYNALKKVEEPVSLSTYIRHSIHHPENKSNAPFSEKELKKSIDTLRTILGR